MSVGPFNNGCCLWIPSLPVLCSILSLFSLSSNSPASYSQIPAASRLYILTPTTFLLTFLEMNRALPEMLHCFTATGNCADMTVLERQTARLKWHQDQLHHHNLHSYFPQSFPSPIPPSSYVHDSFIATRETGLGGLVLGSVKPDPGLENGWPELGKFETPTLDFGSGLELDPSISRTSSSPPVRMEAKNRESVLSEKLNSAVGRESFKKRKTNTEIVSEEDVKVKMIRVCAEEEGDSKVTDQIQTKHNSTATTAIRETSGSTSKENSKASEVQKQDYIHVRARRGQATDSHSLAERARREKISERMKYLQDLVPGCNKITGKAGMLDEIINYVQSLQKQVEFLSMKLAAVNPRLELNVNVDDIFPKEAHPSSNFSQIGIQSELHSPAYLHFDHSNPMASFCELDPSIPGLRRTISAPVSLPEIFPESGSFPPCSAWDGDLQSLYNVGFGRGRTEAFPSHPYAGSMEISNLKMEM